MSRLALLFLGQALFKAPVLRNYLADAVITLILIVITGLLVASLFVGALYGLHLYLVTSGMAALPAFGVTWLAGLAVLLLVVLMLVQRSRKAFQLATALRRIQSPVSGLLDAIIDSFMDGYNGVPSDRSRRRQHRQ